METKFHKIRNGSGLSSFEKEYYQEYAKKKNNEIKQCDICNCEISYYSISKHKKSKKHLKNLQK